MLPALIVLLSLVPQAAPTPKTETLLQKLLRIAGLTAAPSQMRAPGDAQPGNVWIADLDRHTTRALTKDRDYRSPVFSPVDGTVYALKGDAIAQIDLSTGRETLGARLPDAVRLVGFDSQYPDQLVVVVEPKGANSPLVAVSLKSRSITPLSHDPRSADERQLLAMVRSGVRTYGDTRLYTRTESRAGLTRTVEWTDVYIARGAAEPVNVSVCDGVDCTDPALSPGGRQVAFIRSGREGGHDARDAGGHRAVETSRLPLSSTPRLRMAPGFSPGAAVQR